MVTAVRSHLGRDAPGTERELVEKYVRSVVLTTGRLVIEVYSDAATSYRGINLPANLDADADATSGPAQMMHWTPSTRTRNDRPVHRLSIPWTASRCPSRQRRSRRWSARPIRNGAQSTAPRHRQVHDDGCTRSHSTSRPLQPSPSRKDASERHIRFLAPLAYLSPNNHRGHIADGRVPAELTISCARPRPAQGIGLRRMLSHSRLRHPDPNAAPANPSSSINYIHLWQKR